MKQDFLKWFSQDPQTLFPLCQDAALIKELIKEAKLLTPFLTIQLQFPDSSLLD